MKAKILIKTTVIAAFVTTATLVGLNSCAVIYHPDPKIGDNSAIDGGPYSLVVIGANNQQIARHVTTKKTCPKIVVDGQSFQMLERSKDNPPSQFEQVISCEYSLGPAVNSVSIENVPLAVLPKQVERIVIIGDTGCRMKVSTFQNCNNVEGGGEPWPFAELAEQLAKESADVILHMGDYHYRETPCPIYNQGCQGPWGFNWASWQADFFEPAQPILNKFPWLLTRGNHEDCHRAFKGWFYFLDPIELPKDIWQNCIEYTPSYKVEFNDLTVLQMDSATLPNPFSPKVNPVTQKIYQDMFDEINQLASETQQAWFVTHRPIWAISSYYDWNRFRKDISTSDYTMQAAIKTTKLGKFDDKIKLILSGHIHNFEAITYSVDRPSLMVVGDSGTRLSPVISEEQKPKLHRLLEQIKVDPADFFVDDSFAYVIMERQSQQQWLVYFKGIDGKTRKTFVLRGKRLQPTAEG